MSNKKTISTIVLLSLLAGAAYLLWKKKGSSSDGMKKMNPSDLPDNLKAAFQTLSAKGYKPETNPITHPNPFITFSFKEGEQKFDVIINKNLLISIVEKGGLSIPPIQFVNGDFIQNGYVLAEDNDIVNGILQIIQNKDYRP